MLNYSQKSSSSNEYLPDHHDRMASTRASKIRTRSTRSSGYRLADGSSEAAAAAVASITGDDQVDEDNDEGDNAATLPHTAPQQADFYVDYQGMGGGGPLRHGDPTNSYLMNSQERHHPYSLRHQSHHATSLPIHSSSTQYGFEPDVLYQLDDNRSLIPQPFAMPSYSNASYDAAAAGDGTYLGSRGARLRGGRSRYHTNNARNSGGGRPNGGYNPFN